jgi:hypothetical protein
VYVIVRPATIGSADCSLNTKMSGRGGGVGVRVAVGESVGVAVSVGVNVDVNVAVGGEVFVAVNVAVGSDVFVAVEVLVGADVFVAVGQPSVGQAVGVFVGPDGVNVAVGGSVIVAVCVGSGVFVFGMVPQSTTRVSFVLPTGVGVPNSGGTFVGLGEPTPAGVEVGACGRVGTMTWPSPCSRS